MLLAIDVGNTNLVVGVFEGSKLIESWRLATDNRRSADEYGTMIESMIIREGIKPSEIDDIIISSVVPSLLFTLEHMCLKFYNKNPIVVEQGIKTGIKLHYENPRAIGADRIVNVVGAYEQYGGPLIVIDIGTATTFDVVAENGDFLGGVIAPGIGTSADALFQQAAQLPRIELVPPKQVICRNTIQGMQAGIIFGYVGQIDEIVRRIKEEMGCEMKVIATGGLAKMIAKESATIDKIDHFLTLTGLRALYERNQVKAAERKGQE